MRSIALKRKSDLVPVPMGNRFYLSSIRDVYVSPSSRTIRIDTGLEFSLADDLILTVESIVKGAHVLDFGFEDGVLKVAVVGSDIVEIQAGSNWAIATIRELPVAKIRFLETTEAGTRVVRGDAQEAVVNPQVTD